MAVYGDTRLGSAIEQLIGGNFGRADPQAVGQAQLTKARTDRQNQETLAREMLGNAIISSLETGMTPREMMANIYGRGVQISDGFARAAPGFARGAGLGIYGTDQLGTRMAADLMMGAGGAFSSTEMGFQQAEAGRNSRNAATIAGAYDRAVLGAEAAMERAILSQDRQDGRNDADNVAAMERAVLGQDRQDGRNDADNAAAMERFLLAEEGRMSRAGQSADGGTTGTRALTQAELSRVDRMVRSAGFEGARGAEVIGAIVEAYGSGQFNTLDQAAAAILPGVEIRQEVIDPHVLGDGIGNVFQDIAFTNPTLGPETLYIPSLGDVVSPPSATPDPAPAPTPAPEPVEGTGVDANAEAILQEARTAIERGADPTAVRARLRELGLDPGAL